MQGAKPFTIGFVTDPTLSREKTQIALRAVNALRSYADVRYYPGNLSEEDLITRVSKESFDLLLVPWHSYLHTHKLEAHFGLTRMHGPTVVGYFAEDISPFELQEEDHRFRAILVDLNRLTTEESSSVIKSLLRDSTRWGLKPLLQPANFLHYETWNAQVGLGFRIDSVLELNEIASSHWNKRSNTIRILISALWSLIFDNGPGKADRGKMGSEKPPRGYFEVSADSRGLGLRLCYVEPGWKVKDVLHQFWPGALTPSTAGQVLLQYADFLRVHVDPENSEIEVTVMLYPSAPSERAHDSLRTLWIEPLSHLTRLERFTESPETQEHYHKPLITNHDLIGRAAEKIDLLKKELTEKTGEIQNLKSKGNASENIFIYPAGLNGDQLLELFNRRVTESKLKIKSLQSQILLLRKDRNEDRLEATRLMQEIREHAASQKSWISKISETIENYHKAQAVQEEKAEAAASALSGTAKTAAPEGPQLSEEDLALSVAGTEQRQVKTPPKKALRKAS